MTTRIEEPIVCPMLIGRGPALALWERLAEACAAGRGTVVEVAGEAGIGKSRLIAELRARAGARGWRVIAGQCSEIDRHSPYAPLRQLFSELGSDPQLERVLDLRRRFDRLTQRLAEAATAAPLMVVLEDVHWSDHGTLGFIRHLAERAPGLPILLLASYRAGALPPGLADLLLELDRGRLAVRLVVGPLSRQDVDTMCRAIFPDRLLAPSAIRALHRLTDGNPYFIEEVLKSLTDAGKLSAGGSGAQLGPDWGVPESVHQLVLRRAADLPEKARKVLRLAAVAGREFRFTVLTQVSGIPDPEVVAALEPLIWGRLLRELDDDRFQFWHALTREAIYEAIIGPERRRLHRAILEVLEAGNAGDSPLSELAYHAYAARSWESALRYSKQAADHALTVAAPFEAAEHAARALAAAQHVAGANLAELHQLRARALDTFGDLEAAGRELELAVGLATTAGDRRAEWRARLDLAAHWSSNDYPRAGMELVAALRLAEAMEDPAALAETLNRNGNSDANTGRPAEALRDHERALGLFESIGDRAGVAATRDLMGTAAVFAGDLRAAVAHLDLAVDLFRELGDRAGLASSLAARGPFAASPALAETTAWSGWPAAASLADGEEAAGLMRQLDWPAGLAYAAIGMGPTSAEFGQMGKALEWTALTLAIAEEIGHRQWLAAAAFGLGHLDLHLVAPRRAQEHFAAALEHGRAVGSTWWEQLAAAGLILAALGTRDFRLAAETLSALPTTGDFETLAGRRLRWAAAEFALAAGETGRALESVERLLATVPGGAQQSIPHLLRLRGLALAGDGALEESARELLAALAGAEERGQKTLQWQLHADLTRVFRRRRSAPLANGHLARAQTLVAEIADTLADDAIREPFLGAAEAALPARRDPTRLRAARTSWGGLTRREREVVELIALGRSNREIAARLFVSEGTAATHVSNILRKLDCDTRAQIAAWVAQHGLGKNVTPAD